MILFDEYAETDAERLDNYEDIVTEINSHATTYGEKHTSILLVKILLIIARVLIKKTEEK